MTGCIVGEGLCALALLIFTTTGKQTVVPIFDLFAMLLGGVSALLPVYARDILAVGPWGLGLLRAAPGIGSILVAAFLLRHPVKDHAGVIMFVCVTLVGFFIAVFGASTAVWLSVLALGLRGGFDMVSVYVRETLIQIWTPDAVGGRVNAVNMVFVGASNELGEFRAGISAWAFGVVPAVIIGGAATIGVSVLWWCWFPQLRKTRHLQAPDARRCDGTKDRTQPLERVSLQRQTAS
ncbi:MFS family enterobactin exporter EntS protein (plasmid) [Rhizobium sp. N6212]|nr:MFS family enterobactin exporter EntS protein [Rhizobium sp. N6212]ANL00475.1 MFS family enterobactin exporter EntS protein [Rhizobium sp. N621]ANL06596.1 MFS family enterobactin exporter EntS protein [Rhizobium esperanzae]ANL12767.1 MFS family enterobactin exporter EntS protein [Rhizobium sp. N1341]ANL24753.1 MFS family enterobactin exporter EntS protein [Rhizobium sp. N113]ANM37440.1 MFS family enterobactin exporter EntS protein [Rhizobium sp. N871]ANM43590.1 MFS family enterobactin expo